MAAPTVLDAAPLTLTRVCYLDILIPPEPVGLTPSEVAQVPWVDQCWAADDQVRVGAAAWLVSDGADVVAIDPFRNADDILHDPASAEAHQAGIEAAFAEAGLSPQDVTVVLLSHIEGIGFVAVAEGDRWVPFFPNARILIGETALDHFEVAPEDHWATDVWRALLAEGLVETYADGDEIIPGLLAEWTGDHNPGHHVFHIGSGPAATFVGHLAVVPLHLSTGPCLPQHDDPDGAWRRLRSYAADGRILLGPLWPSPGAGTWDGVGFVAAEPRA